jgi:hypothetical protein
MSQYCRCRWASSGAPRPSGACQADPYFSESPRPRGGHWHGGHTLARASAKVRAVTGCVPVTAYYSDAGARHAMHVPLTVRARAVMRPGVHLTRPAGQDGSFFSRCERGDC